MGTHSFSRFLFCDTNILSYLAKHRELWPSLAGYLLKNDLTLALSTQAAELADADRLHPALAQMLVSLPAGIIKTGDVVLAEEVAAHPGERTETLLTYRLADLQMQADGFQQVKEFLASAGLRDARDRQRLLAQQLLLRHEQRKANFPPAAGGKYTRAQSGGFAGIMAFQWLAGTHRAFLETFQPDFAAFNDRPFSVDSALCVNVVLQVLLGWTRPRPNRSRRPISPVRDALLCGSDRGT